MWGRQFWPSAYWGSPYWPTGTSGIAPPVVSPSSGPGGGKSREPRRRRATQPAAAHVPHRGLRDPVFSLEAPTPSPPPIPAPPPPPVAALSAGAATPTPEAPLPKIVLLRRRALPVAEPPDWSEAISALMKPQLRAAAAPLPTLPLAPPPWLQDEEDLLVLAHVLRR